MPSAFRHGAEEGGALEEPASIAPRRVVSEFGRLAQNNDQPRDVVGRLGEDLAGNRIAISGGHIDMTGQRRDSRARMLLRRLPFEQATEWRVRRRPYRRRHPVEELGGVATPVHRPAGDLQGLAAIQ